MQGSALQGARLIFRREVACAMRSRSSWAAMFMFSLTAIAALSFALRCAPPEPQVAAGLLWVVLFFSAEAGVGRAFYEEAASGTLLAARPAHLCRSAGGVRRQILLHALHAHGARRL